jgi:hypothetical protein
LVVREFEEAVVSEMLVSVAVGVPVVPDVVVVRVVVSVQVVADNVTVSVVEHNKVAV